jgi:hypothetical protein
MGALQHNVRPRFEATTLKAAQSIRFVVYLPRDVFWLYAHEKLVSLNEQCRGETSQGL